MQTGTFIPVQDRIGILDRKLRIVSENTSCLEDWIKWATRSIESVYGFEFQGVSKSCHGGAKWNDMLLIFDK